MARADLAVIETYEGHCAIARASCRCCGWSGVDAFDVGLRALDVELTEWEWDEPIEAACPSCGSRELHFPDGLAIPVASD